MTTTVCRNMNRAAFGSSLKRVNFLDYNSEEEVQRTVRGPPYRRRLRAEWKQKQLAAHQDRLRERRDLAEKTYNALILDRNHGPLDRLARENESFRKRFQELFKAICALPPFAAVARGRTSGTAHSLGRIQRAGVPFDQIVQHEIVIGWLADIGYIPIFYTNYLEPPQLSSDDSGDDQSTGEPAAAAAGGRNGQPQTGSPPQGQGTAQAHEQAPQNVQEALKALCFTHDQINDCFQTLGGSNINFWTAIAQMREVLDDNDLPPALRRQGRRPHDENEIARSIRRRR